MPPWQVRQPEGGNAVATLAEQGSLHRAAAVLAGQSIIVDLDDDRERLVDPFRVGREQLALEALDVDFDEEQGGVRSLLLQDLVDRDDGRIAGRCDRWQALSRLFLPGSGHCFGALCTTSAG